MLSWLSCRRRDLCDPRVLVNPGGWQLKHFPLSEQPNLQLHEGPISFDGGDGHGFRVQYDGRSPQEEMLHLQRHEAEEYKKALADQNLPADTPDYPRATSTKEAEDLLQNIYKNTVKLWDGKKGKVEPLLSKGWHGKSKIHVASMPGSDPRVFNDVVLMCLEEKVGFGVVWEKNWDRLWLRVWTMRQVEAAKAGKQLLVLTKPNGGLGFNQSLEVALLRQRGLDFSVLTAKALLQRTRPLVQAAWYMNHDLAESLLRTAAAGALLRQRENSGQQPLHLFTHTDASLPLLRLALQKGAELEASDFAGGTPLHIAAQTGSTQALRALLDARAAVDQAMNDGWTPLLMASHNGQVEALQALLHARAAVDQTQNNGATPLFIASQLGQVEAVRALLHARAAVDKAGVENQTSLSAGSFHGHVEAVQLLLNARACVVLANDIYGASPLLQAAESGHVEVTEQLLAAGANTEQAMSVDYSHHTPLTMAAMQGQSAVCHLLLRAGANRAHVALPKGEEPYKTRGGTAAALAQEKGFDELASALQKEDAEQASSSETPLFTASATGHVEVLQTLLASRAAIDEVESRGRTPLFAASLNGHVQAVRVLLAARAAVDKAEASGGTPLYVAAQEGHAEALQTLLDARAALNQAEASGASPLFIAAQNGQTQAVKQLLEARAQMEQAMSADPRHTPLTVAAMMGHRVVCSVLLGAGASSAHTTVPKAEEPFKTSGGTAAAIAHERRFHGLAQLLQAEVVSI